MILRLWKGLVSYLQLPFYYVASLLGSIVSLRAKKATAKTPVVLMHGFMARDTPFLLLKWRLEREGYQVFLPDFGWNTQSIDALSSRLEQYLAQRHIKKFIFIGHSMGGLIGLHYYQTHKGEIEQFISLGTPYHGSPLAHLASFCSAGKDMLPGSPVLARIRSGKKPKRALSIATRFDEQVPLSSTKLEGVAHQTVATAGHVSFLFDPKIFSIIQKELSQERG